MTIQNGIKNIFMGDAGPRAGWRFAAYLTSFLLLDDVLTRIVLTLTHYQPSNGFSAGDFVVFDGVGLIAALIVSLGLIRLEHKRMEWFGFPLRAAFRMDFWVGTLFGAGMVSSLLLVALLGKGATIHGLALHGPNFLKWLLLWIAAMLLVGFSEELQFRGYALASLIHGIGFWPASLLLSLVFGGLHYFGKPMETVADGLSVTLLGLFVCFTLRRTGSLWFAIGFHAAFDFFALGLYGAPNTGNNGLPLDNHLMDVTYSGPSWLTGGPQGLEASWVIFPLLAAMFALVHRRYRECRFPRG